MWRFSVVVASTTRLHRLLHRCLIWYSPFDGWIHLSIVDCHFPTIQPISIRVNVSTNSSFERIRHEFSRIFASFYPLSPRIVSWCDVSPLSLPPAPLPFPFSSLPLHSLMRSFINCGLSFLEHRSLSFSAYNALLFRLNSFPIPF